MAKGLSDFLKPIPGMGAGLEKAQRQAGEDRKFEWFDDENVFAFTLYVGTSSRGALDLSLVHEQIEGDGGAMTSLEIPAHAEDWLRNELNARARRTGRGS